MKNAQQNHTIFAIHYAALFSGMGIIVPYIPQWLDSQNLSSQEVATVLATTMLVKVFMGPFFSSLADKIGDRKKILSIIAGIYFLCVLTLPFANSFLFILILWGIGGSLAMTKIPIYDSISIIGVKHLGINYGNARVWGSVSFIVVSISAGWVIGLYGSQSILIMLALLSGLSFFTSFLLPRVTTTNPNKNSPSLWQAWTLPNFKSLLIAAALIQASHAALYSFASIHWKGAGLSDLQIGLLWGEGVLFEAIVFANAKSLVKNFDVTGLLSLACSAALIRWGVLGYTSNIYALIAVQTLHSLTFAATHLAIITYITRKIPDQLSSSAQGLYDTFSMGIIIAFAMWISGIAYAFIEAKIFWLMMGFVLLSSLILWKNWTQFMTNSEVT